MIGCCGRRSTRHRKRNTRSIQGFRDRGERERLFRVQGELLRRQDALVGVGIAFGDFRADADQALVFQLAHCLGCGLGQLEQFLEGQLAPFLDDVPDLLLALRQRASNTGQRQHVDEQTFPPAFLFLAHGLRQNALQREFNGTTIVIGYPAGQPQNLWRHQ